jgi:hypothetical protein
MTIRARARTCPAPTARTRLVVVALATAILALVITATAAARPPLQGTFSVPLTFTCDCGTFTLHEDAFDDVHFIRLFDGNGVPGPLQIHHSFRAVITNPEGQTFADNSNFTELIDIAGDFDESNDTVRQVGEIFSIKLPRAGIVVHDTGVITFYSDGTVTFHGPHDEFVQGDALLCTTLG